MCECVGGKGIIVNIIISHWLHSRKEWRVRMEWRLGGGGKEDGGSMFKKGRKKKKKDLGHIYPISIVPVIKHVSHLD